MRRPFDLVDEATPLIQIAIKAATKIKRQREDGTDYEDILDRAEYNNLVNALPEMKRWLRKMEV